MVLADVPVERSGQGSGTQSTSRQVGSALGIAILGTVLFLVLSQQLDGSLRAQGLPDAQRTQFVDTVESSAGAVIPGLARDPATAPVAEAASRAFTEATRWSAAVAAGFLLLGLGASTSLSSGRREEEAEGPVSAEDSEAAPA